MSKNKMPTIDGQLADDMDARFSGLEMDRPGDKPIKAVVLPTPVPVPPVKAPTVKRNKDNEVIKVEAKALAEKEVKLANELGFKVDDSGLFFEAGTELWSVGDENLAKYAAEYKALPTLKEVAVQHAAIIKAEERQDTVLPMCTVGIDGSGQLRERGKPDGACLKITDQAFQQLGAFRPDVYKGEVGRGKGRKGRAARAEAANALPLGHAWNVNEWLPTVDTKTLGRFRHRRQWAPPAPAGTEPVIRREAFAVFNGGKRGYQPFDTDKLLTTAAKFAPDIKVEYQYNVHDTRVRARCIQEAPIDIPAFVGVGRVHRIGFDLRAADNGTLGIHVRPFLIRVRCRNASLVKYGGKATSFRHVGDHNKLKEAVESVLAEAASAVDQMKELWTTAAGEWYLDNESGDRLSVDETFRRMVGLGYLPSCGLSEEAAVEAYIAAWRAEDSPSSSQGIIMAAQRAAHEGLWKTKWADDEIEEAASELLYSTVYRLDDVQVEGD